MKKKKKKTEKLHEVGVCVVFVCSTNSDFPTNSVFRRFFLGFTTIFLDAFFIRYFWEIYFFVEIFILIEMLISVVKTCVLELPWLINYVDLNFSQKRREKVKRE